MAGRARVCLTLMVVLVMPPPGAAGPDDSREQRATVTLGAVVASLLMGTVRIDGIGLRAGVPVHDRVDFEVEADWLVRTSSGATEDALSALYFLQGRRALTRADGRRYIVFATYGAAGWIQREPFFLVLPMLPQVGAGVQFAVGRRYGIRVDAQAILGLFNDLRPFTGRVSGGIAFPLGRAPVRRVRRSRLGRGAARRRPRALPSSAGSEPPAGNPGSAPASRQGRA